MPSARLAMLLPLTSAMLAAQPVSFDAAHVLPSGGNEPAPLRPGLLVSIYGEGLGPSQGCQGQADPARRETPSPLRPSQLAVETLIYPTELCGVQVILDGVPAGLLYVQSRQINFKVPQQTPVTGSADLSVRYGAESSRVRVPLGLETTTVSLEAPARAGMPVWLRVSVAEHKSCVGYPFDIHPEEWWSHRVEVRREGRLLPRIPLPGASPARVGSYLGPCGHLGLPGPSPHAGRVPLHLWYRFDQPGKYEVRYVPVNGPGGPFAESGWTPIEILPGTPQRRAAWLAEQAVDPPTDTIELLTDFLPSILGMPDEASLRLVTRYLYHPDPLVRRFAASGLAYWPPEQIRRAVGELARVRGSNDAVEQVLNAPR